MRIIGFALLALFLTAVGLITAYQLAYIINIAFLIFISGLAICAVGATRDKWRKWRKS